MTEVANTPGEVWVVVLVKDFDSAKSRLAAVLDPAARQALARENAVRAIRAASAGDRALVVAGGERPADLARELQVEVLVEARPAGQNPAARAGIQHAMSRGAGAVLILSSDIPGLSRRVVGGLLRRARELPERAVLAAPAVGRGGTNALYLRPPDVIGLHFGDRSLPRFQEDARARGVHFELYRSRALALDLDEPSDLARLARRQP